jgi:hypothetical protein
LHPHNLQSLRSNIFSDYIEAVGASDHGCQTLQDPVLPIHRQDLPLELVVETLNLNATLCILDIRKHHYRKFINVKHRVQVQALLGLRDTSVNEKLLLGELVNNSQMIVRENCYAQSIQLQVVLYFKSGVISTDEFHPDSFSIYLLNMVNISFQKIFFNYSKKLLLISLRRLELLNS